MRRTCVAALAALGALAGTTPVDAAVRSVGPGKPYAAPCAAIAAAQPGDVVEIAAGTYTGDSCSSSTPNLTITGVGGRPHIIAPGTIPNQKGIWALSGANTVVRNVEMSGAAVPDQNGAAIRVEGGGDLTLVGSYLHDNENGILTGAGAESDIVVDSTELARNGFGDGQSHNIYVGTARSFTMRRSWSHDAKVGHLVKSRALRNDIVANRLTGQAGSGSYELDLPNGGVSRVAGNAFQQGPATQNPALVAFGLEGSLHPGSALTLVNNTFVNDRTGSAPAVRTAVPAQAFNNLVAGTTAFVSDAGSTLGANCITPTPGFVDRARFDFRLTAGSPCIDIGVATPPGGLPGERYVYDLAGAPWVTVGAAPDAGAFEFGAPEPTSPSGAAPPGAALPAPPPAGPGSTPKPSAPTPAVAIRSRRVLRDGRIRLTVRVAQAGRLTARARAGRTTYASGTARPKRAGLATVTLKPTRTGRRTLQRRKRLAVQVALTFRPATGAPATVRATVKLRRAGSRVRGG